MSCGLFLATWATGWLRRKEKGEKRRRGEKLIPTHSKWCARTDRALQIWVRGSVPKEIWREVCLVVAVDELLQQSGPN